MLEKINAYEIARRAGEPRRFAAPDERARKLPGRVRLADPREGGVHEFDHRRRSAGCDAARRTSIAGLLGIMFAASSSRSSSAISSIFRSAGRRSCPSSPGCGWCSWLGLRAEGKRRNPLRSHLPAVAADGRAASWDSSSRVAVVVFYSPCRCRRRIKYVTFMKVERSVLSQDPPRLAVLDLRHLRRRHHRPLCLDRRGACCAARIPRADATG